MSPTSIAAGLERDALRLKWYGMTKFISVNVITELIGFASSAHWRRSIDRLKNSKIQRKRFMPGFGQTKIKIISRSSKDN